MAAWALGVAAWIVVSVLVAVVLAMVLRLRERRRPDQGVSDAELRHLLRRRARSTRASEDRRRRQDH